MDKFCAADFFAHQRLTRGPVLFVVIGDETAKKEIDSGGFRFRRLDSRLRYVRENVLIGERLGVLFTIAINIVRRRGDGAGADEFATFLFLVKFHQRPILR